MSTNNLSNESMNDISGLSMESMIAAADYQIWKSKKVTLEQLESGQVYLCYTDMKQNEEICHEQQWVLFRHLNQHKLSITFMVFSSDQNLQSKAFKAQIHSFNEWKLQFAYVDYCLWMPTKTKRECYELRYVNLLLCYKK